jgi:tellurium resistance protein TerZ
MAVQLTKGQRISLKKEGETGLSRIIMGLGWDAVKSKGFFGLGGGQKSIDLDASCVLFDEAGQIADVVWFRQLRSRDGSIQHTGDNLTGAGEGDDEQIIVDLDRVPAHIKSLIFTVNSFTGQNFSEVENAFCRVVNAANNEELARYNLSTRGNHTAMIMLKVYRRNGEWKAHAIGDNASGRTFQDLMPAMRPHLA